jgi:hypothetical protein
LVAAAAVSIIIGVLAVVVQAAILRSRTRHPSEEMAAPSGTVDRTLLDGTMRGPELQAAQRKRLGEVGWVDRDGGVAHIPIDRAIDLVVEREGGGR